MGSKDTVATENHKAGSGGGFDAGLS
jgi:hypothetical protein